jgi:Zn-dependent protease with chaperone function
MLAAPVFIQPLFNDYKPVPPGEVRSALEAMARSAGVPTDRVFVYDGSRQSNNFTANVAGLGGTARIAISDVAFKGASLDEVKAVTGHEIGHYVLGHVWRAIAVISVLAMLAFLVADRLFPRFARAFGSSAPLSDPRGLPVILFMVSLIMALAAPVMNSLNRIAESEADRHSLETVNLPDALASALVKTAEYLLHASRGGAARAGSDAVEGFGAGRDTALAPVRLEDLVGQLPDLLPEFAQRLPAGGCGPVVLALLAADDLLLGAQVPGPFHRMQDRVQGPGAQLVAVLLQLLDHLDAEDPPLRRVVEQVHPDEAEKGLAKDVGHDAWSFVPIRRP